MTTAAIAKSPKAPKLSRIQREIETRRMSRRLKAFVKGAWHVLEPSTPFVDGRHIDAICLHLEAVTLGQIRNLVINMPPRHMKSLLLVFWMVWTWIQKPGSRWLTGSYALNLAIRDNLKARRLIESPWFQERWGRSFELTSDQNVKSKFENNKTGYRMAVAVRTGITGEGGDVIVVDDAHNVVDVDSDTKREAVIRWLEEAVSTRGNSPATASNVLCGQRVHEFDAAAWAISKGYVLLCLPAEFELPKDGRKPVNAFGWSDWRTEDGQLLWPERFTRADLDALKHALGTFGTAGQLQQRPVPRGGAYIQRSWFQTYVERPGDLFDWTISVDCTFKETKGSDYVAIGVWARSQKAPGHRYLIHVVRARLDFVATVSTLLSVRAAYPQVGVVLIEDKANGPAVIASLKHKVPGIVPYNPQGSKTERVAAVSPTFEAGNVWVPQSAAWLEDYVAEICAFPRGAHDDQVDMTTQALLRYNTAPEIRIW
jgi:predicted phage terminase large subunit-like protein